MEQFLLPEEIDKILRWRPGKAERLARRGVLPCVRLPNGEIRFIWSDIEKALTKQDVVSGQRKIRQENIKRSNALGVSDDEPASAA